MITEFKIISKQMVIDLHDQLIEKDGGLPGVRDERLLEQSLARPFNILEYSSHQCDVFEFAAALCVSLCRNHAFNDANKRTAFTALYVTLGLNGYYLDVRETDIVEKMYALASGAVSEGSFTGWVTENSYARDGVPTL